jgi:hypothetical protein
MTYDDELQVMISKKHAWPILRRHSGEQNDKIQAKDRQWGQDLKLVPSLVMLSLVPATGVFGHLSLVDPCNVVGTVHLYHGPKCLLLQLTARKRQ